MKKVTSLFFRSIASVLVFSFSSSQLLFAENPRQMLQEAKASFETMDNTRRGGGMNADSLQKAQGRQEALIDQMNALQDVQNLNSSFTTQIESSE